MPFESLCRSYQQSEWQGERRHCCASASLIYPSSLQGDLKTESLSSPYLFDIFFTFQISLKSQQGGIKSVDVQRYSFLMWITVLLERSELRRWMDDEFFVIRGHHALFDDRMRPAGISGRLHETSL